MIKKYPVVIVSSGKIYEIIPFVIPKYIVPPHTALVEALENSCKFALKFIAPRGYDEKHFHLRHTPLINCPLLGCQIYLVLEGRGGTNLK